MSALTPEGVYETLKRFFPAKNDDYQSNYVEELAELGEFHVTTQQQLADLLQRRAEEVMEIDRSPMDDYMIQFYSQDLGEAFVAQRLREGFWFAYPALLRIALELEFGEVYRQYAEKRDATDRPEAASDAAPSSPSPSPRDTEGPSFAN